MYPAAHTQGGHDPSWGEGGGGRATFRGGGGRGKVSPCTLWKKPVLSLHYYIFFIYT